MRASSLSCMALVAMSSLTAYATTPSFQGLGDLPGGDFESQARGVSPDGSFVVGWAKSASGYEAFRWSAATGMKGLGFLPGDGQSFGENVSADGSVAVGTSMWGVGGTTRAFRWTEAAGMVWLGEIYPGDPQGWGQAVSAEGSVAVGTNEAGSTWEAFRWTQATGMVGLGDILGGSWHSRARAVSADGSVVAGDSDSGPGSEAMRWTQAAGMVGLGDLGHGDFHSEARGISADGSVVVGYSGWPEDKEAFRWTAGTGMVGLGDLPGDRVISHANDVSADGNVVVGQGNTAYGWPGEHAFIWDPTNHMRQLQDVLVGEYGLDLTGWTLREASGISDDGCVIVGRGHNPSGDMEAWIAVIPEPATLPLAALGALALTRRGKHFARWRRSRPGRPKNLP